MIFFWEKEIDFFLQKIIIRYFKKLSGRASGQGTLISVKKIRKKIKKIKNWKKIEKMKKNYSFSKKKYFLRGKNSYFFSGEFVFFQEEKVPNTSSEGEK